MWLLMRWCSWCMSCSSIPQPREQLLPLPAPPSGSLQSSAGRQDHTGISPCLCSLLLCSFLLLDGLIQPPGTAAPAQGREKTPKGRGCTGLQCSSPSAGAVESPLLPAGQEGVNVEPRNASVTSPYSQGWPGALQEDPEPGKLSTRVELAPAWPGGVGGSASPRPGALPPLQHPQNSSAPPAGALGMCKEFL